MYRDKLEDLIAWKNDKNRKPLILIGARHKLYWKIPELWNGILAPTRKMTPGKWSGRWGANP